MAEVIFVDNHLLVLNKAAGMLTQPSGSDALSLEEVGKSWLKREFNKEGNVFLQAVHRLDLPVSGVVLFARTSKALSRLNHALRDLQFSKNYVALVEGRLSKEEGVLEHYLLRGDHCSQVVCPTTPHAKKCVLKYRVQKRGGRYTLLNIELITGRHHQIRVQLAQEGFVIVGDEKYGALQKSAHLFLHHGALIVPHPISGERLCFEAPLPPYWPIFD